jgi:hypothetical protein
MGSAWQSSLLMVDGYDVQITEKSAILSRPFLLANDGAFARPSKSVGVFSLLASQPVGCGSHPSIHGGVSS